MLVIGSGHRVIGAPFPFWEADYDPGCPPPISMIFKILETKELLDQSSQNLLGIGVIGKI